jgi:hypothetical protein
MSDTILGGDAPYRPLTSETPEQRQIRELHARCEWFYRDGMRSARRADAAEARADRYEARAAVAAVALTAVSVLYVANLLAPLIAQWWLS